MGYVLVHCMRRMVLQTLVMLRFMFVIYVPKKFYCICPSYNLGAAAEVSTLTFFKFGLKIVIEFLSHSQLDNKKQASIFIPVNLWEEAKHRGRVHAKHPVALGLNLELFQSTA